ncbi:DUF924 family protein [Aliterella atlantica]|uniref:Membrane protein n=1 Tax=Aliterella atlantica CENA595 TaxID=1618023 RepID=A0A0D8ZQS5_9CYAN|nr:DUF924 family protein [Aliterella atlantica]KJH71168.1 membrane protein [Aliterella atlantica CENA595]
MDARVDEILEFWFGAPNLPDYGKERSFWFTKNLDFDKELSDRFLPIYTQAATGELDSWQDSPQSCLALLLLLDQFPRNMFRGTPQSFATDTKALAVANNAVAKGFDRDLLPVQRWFIYLPFEHSENLADQKRCVDLFATLRGDPDSARTIDYALRHKSVIERFGRFPHRNKILGRKTTPEEAEFLKQPGSSF